MSDDLLEIQRLDITVDQLRHRRTSLAERRALEDARADQREQQAAIDHIAAERLEVTGRQRRLEDEAQILAERVATDEGRLYGGEVSALKDLEALQHEIAGLRQRQEEMEDQALEAMEVAERLAGEIARLETARADADDRVDALTAEIARLEVEIDDEITSVAGRRNGLAAGIDAALLDEYERLRPAFGVATAVRFDGSSCVGCPSEMPAMEVDRLRHLEGDAPGSCHECGRIVLR